MFRVTCSMKLIVGLGNPGEKYKDNRHNVGFQFIDYLVQILNKYKNISLKIQKMLHVTCYMFDDLILAKPQTFMNKSGISVAKLFQNYKLRSENLFVVHDDLDIPLGKFKIQKGTGPMLHNGLASIENSIGTKDFWRIRIGVENRTKENWVDGETYVLNDFLENEEKSLLQSFPDISKRLKALLI